MENSVNNDGVGDEGFRIEMVSDKPYLTKTRDESTCNLQQVSNSIDNEIPWYLFTLYMYVDLSNEFTRLYSIYISWIQSQRGNK